jgi:hypothetical protein
MTRWGRWCTPAWCTLAPSRCSPCAGHDARGDDHAPGPVGRLVAGRRVVRRCRTRSARCRATWSQDGTDGRCGSSTMDLLSTNLSMKLRHRPTDDTRMPPPQPVQRATGSPDKCRSGLLIRGFGSTVSESSPSMSCSATTSATCACTGTSAELPTPRPVHVSLSQEPPADAEMRSDYATCKWSWSHA